METKILRVVRQGEAFGVQSAKAEGGSIQKCNIVLRELGGSKFENEYVCAMLGNLGLKTSMCALCWVIWRRASSTKVMWLRPPFVSLPTSIRDRLSKRFWPLIS